jgi:hypothetical protein
MGLSIDAEASEFVQHNEVIFPVCVLLGHLISITHLPGLKIGVCNFENLTVA